MVVSAELYEGQGVDDKTQSESLSSFSNKATKNEDSHLESRRFRLRK